MNMLKTRKGILQSFQKNVDALRNLAEKETSIANAAEEAMVLKRIEMEASKKEAEACRKIADKIEDMISA